MRIVIRIGGSVVASPPNPKLIQSYAEVFRNLRAEGYEIVVVVGGGARARQYIQLAKDIGLKEEEQDEVAISVSRLFAQLLSLKLGGLEWKSIPTSLETVSDLLNEKGIVVMGGLKPGMTTDTVAAMAASHVGAELIVKATDQDGIYTKDPKKYADAKKIDELSFDDLSQLMEQDKHMAGIHQIIDPEAIRILKKNRIKMIVVSGKNPENLLSVLKGEKIGTIIQ
ncbi:UMP kinase [Candidatus Bathyarchaeota archaeon]|nr:UMP kinase [Candidatus Bathyarchaeota archaeon]